MRTLTAEQRIAARYIPQDCNASSANEYGVCYVGSRVVRERTVYYAIGFVGCAGKHSFYESYRTAEQRDKRVAEFLEGLKQSAEIKRQRRADRDKPHTYTVGDIIHHSWGYEQTNCDYYQVMAVTPHGATIQAIGSETVPGSEGFMSDRRKPVAGAFHGEPFKVRIDGHNTVTSLEHGCANKWTGGADYCSWYA